MWLSNNETTYRVGETSHPSVLPPQRLACSFNMARVRHHLTRHSKRLLLNMTFHMKPEEISRVTHVNARVIRRIRKKWEQTGHVYEPNPLAGHPRKLNHKDLMYILSSLVQRPDLTLEELRDRLHTSRGSLVSISTIARSLRRSAFSRKQLSRYALEALAEARADFILTVGSDEYSIEQFVFVDETGCTRNNTKRRYGWSPIGTRVFYGEYSTRSEKYNLIPALSLDGVLHLDIFSCSVNSDLFDLFIVRLLDVMNPWPERNSVIILDNASIHKSQQIRQLVEDR
ncbi:unnamed protein product [Rhizoctonia solani]|uniref:Tc1-like transposase DDE domain-containing protein n=1 Tax=Rhizoctonia solani TaxID=456999 RepID=A0A8H3HYD3_9AGAM|nr:unnamed protein product [Rhizoctonia solani]